MSVSLIRTLILYVAVIAAMRLMGKRQIGELEPSDLVITILISELAAIPMQDLGVPLTAGIIPIAALISIEILVSFLCLKSRRVRRLVNGRGAIIIRSGKLDRHKMSQLRITTDEVMEALRQNNIFSVADVKYGVIEPNGQLLCPAPVGPAGHRRHARSVPLRQRRTADRHYGRQAGLRQSACIESGARRY